MRNYLIFKEKAQRFNEDKEIQALLAEIRSVDGDFKPIPLKFNPKRAEQIKNLSLDRRELAKKRLPYERLDQLVVDLLLGLR
jgi:xylose isomerase